MASTVDDCRKIMAAAARSKGILQIGHICRFNPRYRMAKQAIAEGKIGKIVSLSSRRNIPAAWTPEILNKIGPIVGDAIHDTDLMLWFTGDRIVSAYAQTVDVRGLKYPDIGQTMYRFAGGATATLGDGLVHAGKDAVRHRRAHVDHRRRAASFISRTRSRISASCRATSSTAPTRPTGRCSTACAAAR